MIAVTGHSRDLGKAIYDYFPETQGFSRSNDFDIHRPNEIYLNLNSDVDVFINNARDDTFAQVELFKYIYEQWKNSNKLIINISSLSPDWANSRLDVRMYDIHKQALDTASKMAYYSPVKIAVTNIRSSYMNTPWIHKRGIDPNKMLELTEIIDVIEFIINNWKKNIRIGNIDIQKNGI